MLWLRKPDYLAVCNRFSNLSTPSYTVRKEVSLRSLNTFGMDVTAEALIELHDAGRLVDISADSSLQKPLHVLGGGSNILLTAPVKGTVILNRIAGISVIREDPQAVWLRAGAGVVWHDLVMYAIENGLGGIENLALIPGTVGAAPIQNIGAYGVEVKDTVAEVTAWDIAANKPVVLDNAACGFAYRDSIFKHELKGKVIITAVTFRLSKHPELHTDYGAIRDELAVMQSGLSIQSIAQAVINIRRSKLPDPALIGNAGSFFKNPTITRELFDNLHERFPNLPSYPAKDDMVKVPAGWLIERCGWKGRRIGDAGVHARQALVLVNYGHATGHDIWALSEQVLQSVRASFGIELEREVQVW
jgi:UDP-N-acetylmuramate dehydrogenase